ncbi:MAG TPA: acyltransferase [Armatimonadota bacterium]|nr:acyltransferase [Armatimonadota bacterium]
MPEPTSGPSRRLEQLDSLRGLAALSVLGHHFLFVFPAMVSGSGPYWLLARTPLAIFVAGQQAVIFFFVLSGFVLAIPFLRGPVVYLPFVWRRVCRIWIPYAIAVSTAMVCYQLFSRNGIPGLSSWFNSTWTTPISAGLIGDHFILVDSFKNGVFAPVIWSLVVEMRLSLVFPLLMLLALRANWRVTLAAAWVASFGSFVLYGHLRRHAGWSNDSLLTVHYATIFVIGILLCRHRSALQERYRGLSKRMKWALALFSVLCYTYPYWFFSHSALPHLGGVDDLITAAGVAGFIVMALESSRTKSWLVREPILRLGKISYSLYLWHTIVLLSMVNLLYGVIPLWTILIAAAMITLLVSNLSYEYIERPAIRLGYSGSSKLQQIWLKDPVLSGASGGPVSAAESDGPRH